MTPAPKIRVLLVEDEQTLADIIADTLSEKDFTVTVAYNGVEGLRAFDRERPQVVVTDIMMPGMDGLSLVAELRRRDPSVPILFLSARSAAEDVVRGFEAGGNDYLRKPFAMSELIVRLRALAGRQAAAEPAARPALLAVGRFLFDAGQQRLTLGERVFELSARETALLAMLCERRGEVVPTQLILQRIWGDDSFFNARSLHVFVTRLRHRLASDPDIRLVNARGVGYKLLF
ncbi:response regulator transcription factor [uncultured Alistipes sp.]|uniref:response regulator transcription factor n=1 Tax=uncultured Alistipes sp. TaxID=538949 RepID=UPI0025EACFAE|nr:response regulator transcription factor [uncultured Alistipes sp.]